MRTFKEKLAYNARRKDSFSVGYKTGAELYAGYMKLDKKSKKFVREIISESKELAKSGDRYGKGFMCGVRDAANERKKGTRLDF